MAIDLSTAEARLTAYLDAEAKILQGQRVRMGDRDMTRADLGEIRRGIAYWESKVEALSNTGGIRVRGIRPYD